MKALQRLTLLEIGNNDVQLATEIGELVQLRELEVFVQAGHSLEVQQALARSVDKLRLCYLHEDNIDVEYMGEILAAE
jgi:hypothetical protein